MGGGSIATSPLSTTPSEDEQVVSQLSPSSLKPHPLSSDELKGEVSKEAVNDRSVFGELKEMGPRISSTCLEEEDNLRRRSSAYKEVLESYKQLEVRTKSLKEAKSKLLSYTPGAWVEKVGNIKASDFDVPLTTTLLLVGPKGSGKSSLVNKITNVFEDDMYASERAQVSYNSSTEDGTYFLQAYMIPRGSTSFCLYDTRGFSDATKENFLMLKHFISEGVCDGKLIIRPSDSSTLKTRLKLQIRRSGYQYKERRMANFVIFVVDALTVLKSMNGDLDGEVYTRTLATTFKWPYLAFKDDKPVVVVTHGDLLSLADRARVRTHLGELLGIPPAKQIFDIPDNRDPVTELTIVDMLRYSLEHADKHLPRKCWLAEKFRGVSVAAILCVFIILLIAIISVPPMQHSQAVSAQKPEVFFEKTEKPEVDIDWFSIRHMWMG